MILYIDLAKLNDRSRAYINIWLVLISKDKYTRHIEIISLPMSPIIE